MISTISEHEKVDQKLAVSASHWKISAWLLLRDFRAAIPTNRDNPSVFQETPGTQFN